MKTNQFLNRGLYPEGWKDDMEKLYQRAKRDGLISKLRRLKACRAGVLTGKILGDFPETVTREFFRFTLEVYKTGELTPTSGPAN
jgi:hypothetical protein